MVVKQRSTNVRGYALALVTLIAGVIMAALVATMPQDGIDAMAGHLALTRIIPAAAPPIGATGRTLLALAALMPFVAIAAGVWRLFTGVGGAGAGRRAVPVVAERGPTVRRADAHPDCPPRFPIRADADLGPPLPMVIDGGGRTERRGEQPLPADLDQPLAAFDPIAIPDVPREPARAVPPLATVVIPAREADAIVAVEPTPAREPDPHHPGDEPAVSADMPEPEPEVAAASEPDPELPRAGGDDEEADSIAGLLDRLERGARRRKEPPADQPASEEPAASLDETLVMLRRMARR